MERSEIRAMIDANLRQAGLMTYDLRIQPDPYSGWRLVVIASGFDGMTQQQRQETVLKGLERPAFQLVELLTPEEKEFAGDLPIDSGTEELPLWAEALARVEKDGKPALFPSELDEDLRPPIIATFYSLRGGIGRSTALAYTAQLLARRGRSVLCIDMDLEAPGLAALFDLQSDRVRPDMGALSILLALDQGDVPDVVNHVIRVSDSDELYCLPAGVPDANYARRLRLIDPEAWYREESNPLRQLIDLVSRLPFKPEVVLIDARTGLTPISAPLLFDISDVAIVGFFPHPQAVAGTGALVRALRHARSRREYQGQRLTPETRFLISPIPPRQIELYKRRAQAWISEWLETPAMLSADLEDVCHFVQYSERIATSDCAIGDEEASHLYNPVADWIDRFLPSPTEANLPPLRTRSKQEILETLEFSPGVAESQDDLRETFVRTDVFERAMSPDKVVVQGRKGTGKTALFRYLSEDPKGNSTVVMCPPRFRGSSPWVPDSDGFKFIEREISRRKSSWREFWDLYTTLACLERFGDKPWASALLREASGPSASSLGGSHVEFVARLVDVLGRQWTPSRAWDRLLIVDRRVKQPIFLLFDGLDTGFGNDAPARQLRQAAIEGLFAFILERSESLKHLAFKVFLRKDIWNKLRLDNKSHLDARSITLEWRDPLDYAKTVLKQALRSKKFAAVAKKRTDYEPLADIPDRTALDMWSILVGERMKGLKSARTLTWVWNRLADGKGDHSPRALFQLFREAMDWERREQRATPYDRSVIRPRALRSSLDAVSARALDALLQEEFSELQPLADRLRRIGRSPFDRVELEGVDGIDLALEVGLLMEEASEAGGKYRVPDLYRIELEMTRMGQP